MYFDLQVEAGDLEPALRVQAIRLARRFYQIRLKVRFPNTLGAERVEMSEAFGTAKFAFSVFVQSAFHGQGDVPIKQRTRTITVNDVQRFHAATFRPERCICVLAARCGSARKSIEDAFGTIRRRKMRRCVLGSGKSATPQSIGTPNTAPVPRLE